MTLCRRTIRELHLRRRSIHHNNNIHTQLPNMEDDEDDFYGSGDPNGQNNTDATQHGHEEMDTQNDHAGDNDGEDDDEEESEEDEDVRQTNNHTVARARNTDDVC